MFSIHGVKLINRLKQCRQASTNLSKNGDIAPVFTNRNPRNLEKIRVAYKPDGYHVEKPGRRFWHKLHLKASGRYLTATINHFENGEVIKASTSEWAIKKQLYRTLDTSAYINLGRVLADRCLQSGIIEVSCNIQPPTQNGKVALFLKTLQQNGVTLEERLSINLADLGTSIVLKNHGKLQNK
ncbi:hypothetical protein NQ314_000325 [Rhamnusium bicolor]|uniref:Large ribosomal subunit protein uL18m n=1 Tax=Rhamnusium bicolor TaxID=1586634 RepID=A0AAV8ZYE0_9CUCU|nr:hypothetical protein NQ314_000325 [Rhamnusium bicolor]